MRQFRNDYSEGAAPEILDALVRTNAQQTPGYGEDEFCAAAADLIRAICGQPDAFVKFIPGGTRQTSLPSLRLRTSSRGPFSLQTRTPPSTRRALSKAPAGACWPPATPLASSPLEEAERVWRVMTSGGCHTTRPGMIYFSNTTEFGHAYTQAEFDALCGCAVP